MPEYVGAIHAHTTASDGAATFEEIIGAARKARLDFLVTTDHNCLPLAEAGYREGVLLLVGQEVHDPARDPQVNHLLCLGVEQDCTDRAANPQALIDAVKRQGGLAFIAHPFERAPAFTHEPPIPWVDWDVQGIHGIEIWNYMSEFKAHATSLRRALRLIYAPTSVIEGPFAETLAKWDELLRHGPVVAIGGPDAHGWRMRRGPLSATVLPYPFLFRAVRTHVLTSAPLSGRFTADQSLVLEALRAGRAFVGYDAIGSTNGFTFVARQGQAIFGMGETVERQGEVRLEARAPGRGELRLLRDGIVIARSRGHKLMYQARTPGAYRVEVYRCHWLKQRAWIFSNPIFVR